jgi:hypothetical protein
MRIKTEVAFSLILPSRSRPYLLNQCLTSFFAKASNPARVEAIVLCDFDDTTMRHFESLVLSNDWNIKIVFQRRSHSMIHNYNNYGSQCSTGKYIWQINDDVEMVNHNWDHITETYIDRFLSDKPDRIMYVHIDDSTHVNDRQDFGCCFPILSKESVDAQNCHMPDEIGMWGADVWLYNIYKRLPNRILDLRDSIKLLHHSRHNGSVEPDPTAQHVLNISTGKCYLTSDELEMYVNLLDNRIIRL